MQLSLEASFHLLEHILVEQWRFCLLLLHLILGGLRLLASLKQLLNLFFQISMAWVAFVDDFLVLINQGHKWDSTEAECLEGKVFSIPPILKLVMLDFQPLLRCDSLFDIVHLIIHGQTNYLDLVAPVLVLLQHFLVMSHRPLARAAPSCLRISFFLPKNRLT